MVVILVGCELFTNGVEWFGRHLKLGDGSVGSILAAVGTALPETIVPVIAIVLGATADSEGIAVGAIVGSSFMLATLALCVTGLAVGAFALTGRRSTLVKADPLVIGRDLRFFIITYAATIIAALLQQRGLQIAVAFALVVAYAVYVYQTIKGDKASEGALHRLYLQPHVDTPHVIATCLQLIIALAIIVVGARYFVSGIEGAAHAIAVPALLLSLLVTPFATELPEKLNSVIWIRQGKDTLALGNITGAMVFQACILPAIGILFTTWDIPTPALIAAGLGLASAAGAYLQVRKRGSLHYRYLIAMGAVYFVFAAYVIIFAR
jgi:cation:H+ antiporter